MTTQTNLMIIESPGKLKKLREIMAKLRPGEHWLIEPSVGHIRDLPTSGTNEGEITTGIKGNFMPTYELSERGAEVVAKLTQAASRASVVYLATDPDREGESIAWHLKEALGLKRPIRIGFNEITEGKVREALENPGSINMRLVSAQEARRVLDRLVGYLVSPELRRQTGEILPAGRVQSVAVLLVVRREREIQAFKSTLHFGATLYFAGAKPGEQWEAEWATDKGFVTDEQPYFMDRDYANQVAGMRDLTVVSFDDKPEKRNPPAPYTTSTLQQAASNKLSWDASKAMKVAQELYEQGLISYHRTDNPNVSEEAMPAIREAADALGLPCVEKRRIFKAKDGAQEGHPGITPTYWLQSSAGETSDQRTLYELIHTRALASQLMPATFNVRRAVLQGSSPVDGRPVTFVANGETLADPGWKRLLDGDATDESDAGESGGNPIPALSAGQAVMADTGELEEYKTRAPKRYTQASLIKTLEDNGIGRPATYAPIINNIMARELIGEEKRFFKPMPKGELIIKCLEGKFSFLDVDFTRNLEGDLDAISHGKTQYHPVIQQLYGTLQNELTAQQAAVPAFTKVEPVYDCPTCERPMRRLKSAHGYFWSCTGYPDDCDVSLPDDHGKPGKRKEINLSEHACGKCGKPLIRRQKKGPKGYDFWGCSGFKEGCEAKYQTVKGKGIPDYDRVK